jgi:hypothetical protein
MEIESVKAKLKTPGWPVMFKTFAKFLTPSGLPAPALWGNDAVVRERLGSGVSKLTLAQVSSRASDHTPAHRQGLLRLTRDCPSSRKATDER